MSLIICPECNGKISEYANVCVHCGCPMNIIQKIVNNKEISINEEKVEAVPKIKVGNNKKVELSEYDEVIMQTWLDEGIVLIFDGNALDLIDYETFGEYIEGMYEDDNLSEEELDKAFCREALKRNIKTLNKLGLSRAEITKLIDKWKKNHYL